MSKFVRSDFNLKSLADNSYKAIDQGAYDTSYDLTHDPKSLKKAILSCPRAPLITEIKFASPSHGQIRKRSDPKQVAADMVASGAIGLSVLTQPFLFDGSLENLAATRKAVGVPLLMKDIIVSEVQVQAAKRVGADCILLIKSIFDQNLAEGSMESFVGYAKKKELQVIIEVHQEREFEEVLKAKYDLIGINNRNLENLQVDISTTEKLLSKHGKGKGLIISESGISRPEDVQYLSRSGADAFLVGTSIMENGDVAAKVRELYNSL